jgi:hypothetical protein
MEKKKKLFQTFSKYFFKFSGSCGAFDGCLPALNANIFSEAPLGEKDGTL